MQAFAFYKLAFVLHSIMKEKQTLKLFYNSLSLRMLTFPFCNRSCRFAQTFRNHDYSCAHIKGNPYNPNKFLNTNYY